MVVAAVRNNYNASQLRTFYEADRKGGYPSLQKGTSTDQKSEFWHIRNGLRLIGDEFKLFKEEVKERFANDPLMIYRQHEIDVVWRFNGDKESLDKWVVSSDSDFGEGHSSCR